MRNILLTLLMAVCLCLTATAQTYSFGKGQLRVTPVGRHAVRIQYSETGEGEKALTDLPDWIYNGENGKPTDIRVVVDNTHQRVCFKDRQGRTVLTALRHELHQGVATLTLQTDPDDYQYGLGQFQDGYLNVHGLSRRLTQVNTQISIPMILSSKGYGVLWNNYGLTEFNPSDQAVALVRQEGPGVTETVNVTSTEGGKSELREHNIFRATLSVDQPGDYALLLDVGQKMARRHHLTVDGKTVIDARNLWLPPTASAIVHLDKGTHDVVSELTKGDRPTLYYHRVGDETVFRSHIAGSVDYTVFVGSPDDIIAAYREATGEAPLMPAWALGYIHSRERFHSSDEILRTARRFRKEHLPLDMIVQDWQYWGKYGWNAMRFDEQYYPDPKTLADSLHDMNVRLMLSVWSKVDRKSEVGQQMAADNYYIPNTDWIDFFNPKAAAAYWKNFRERLVPYGIDAWWQDATEPENDDLAGRLVNNGRWKGEWVRNVFPLLVNKTVGEGLDAVQPGRRHMILTRCGFPGIQRYGSALWSGDVGNDWDNFRKQITAGLGLQATGIPWWTYDAGGFFRPGKQYTDTAYIQRMIRWIDTSVYLPLMRVHGYISNTEPWNYGPKAQQTIAECLNDRYRLLPYIYSGAAAVSFDGSTLMRPLVFDFADDTAALSQRCEYMFGKALLISPVTEPDKTTWATYLPKTVGGWYDFRTGRHYGGAQTVTTAARRIPVFARAGSIVPLGPVRQYATQKSSEPLEIRVYPGADGSFTLYEDDGVTVDYGKGRCSRITFLWDDTHKSLTISKRNGSFPTMEVTRQFKVVVAGAPARMISYKGNKVTLKGLFTNPDS